MKNLICLFVTTLLITSCASKTKEPKAVNVFDPITLKEVLVEGKTSQAQVLQKLGAPDMTTEDNTKKDVWVYNKNKQESNGSGFDVGGLAAMLPGPLAIVGGAFGADKRESSSASLSLVLVFNKNKVLTSYTLSKNRI